MSKFRRASASVVISLLSTTNSFAQAPVTVQQPSFSSFSVGTTVSVPDRGTASLGAVRSYSSGSTAFGPSNRGGNRTGGQAASALGSSMTATIHDFEAMDAAILNQAGPKKRTPGRAALQADQLTDTNALDVRSAARLREQDLARVAADAERSFARGQEMERAGKFGVARIQYESALKSADAELKPRIAKALSGVIAKQRLAKRAGTAR